MLKQQPINMNGRRSINLIVEAMLELMGTKPFKNITISEITRQAGVVRNTFYAHFNTKEDILSHHMFHIFETGLKAYYEENVFDHEKMSKLYFGLWSENKDFLKLLNDNDLLSILNGFENQLDQLGLTELLNAFCPVSEKAFIYLNTFYASTLTCMIKQWVKTDMKESPEELGKIYLELTGTECDNS